MKITVPYTDFNSHRASCNCYIFAVPSPAQNLYWVVLQQSSSSTISITNCFEQIVNTVWKQHLIKHQPSSLRFFEHYPNGLKLTTPRLSEVTFSEKGGYYFKRHWTMRIARFFRKTVYDYWQVGGPKWTPISGQLAAQLTSVLK